MEDIQVLIVALHSTLLQHDIILFEDKFVLSSNTANIGNMTVLLRFSSDWRKWTTPPCMSSLCYMTHPMDDVKKIEIFFSLSRLCTKLLNAIF
jgi:hypothetical protein